MKAAKKTVIAVLCCIITLAQALSLTAYAAKKITLTVEYTYENLPIHQAQFDIYKIGNTNSKQEITPVSPYSYYALDFSKTDSETMHSLALTLASYIARDGIAPYDSGKTDAQGKIVFPNTRNGISKGLYLIVGRDVKKDGVTYSTEPFLAFLPAKQADGTFSYDVTAKPKATEKHPDSPDGKHRRLKVLKIWDDNNSSERPDEITVDLIRNGKVIDSVNLNKGNLWRYTWDNLNPEGEYYIAERGAPKGYTVLTSIEGVTFRITNKKQGGEEETTKPEETTTPEGTTTPGETTTSEETTKEEEKKPPLPQTGMLRWPIPYLACMGLVLFMAGWVRNRKSEIENEK